MARRASILRRIAPVLFAALFVGTGWPVAAAQPARPSGTEALSRATSSSSRRVDVRQAAANDTHPARASLGAPTEVAVPPQAGAPAAPQPTPVATPTPLATQVVPGPAAVQPAATPTPTPTPRTALVVNRDGGSPLFSARYAYTPATATFTTNGCQSADTTDVVCAPAPPNGGLMIKVCLPGCIGWTWQLVMQAGIGQPLTVGTYSNIFSYRVQPSDTLFWLNGYLSQICSVTVETVTVEEISMDAGGNVLSFAASFSLTQCPYENYANHSGEIRINSTVPMADKTISTNAIDFANETIGTQGPSQTVTVTSAGTKPITLGTAGLTGAGASEFKVTGDTCSGASLQPGATCTMGVAYKPTQPIVASATLAFADNTIAGAGGVSLSGTANVDVTITNTGLGSGVLSVNPGGSCRPTPTCTFNLATGTPINIEAAADVGTTFGGWGGACTGTANCSFWVGPDHAVTVAFTVVGPAVASVAPGSPLASATPATGVGGPFDQSPGAGVAVGLNHVIETTNAGVQIRDRSGNLMTSMSLPAFFDEPLGVSADGDAKVIWDGLHGRWLASEILVDCPHSTSGVEVGISRTDDPLGIWDFYIWAVGGAIAPSHGFGVSDDKVAFSWDEYSYSGGCPHWQSSFYGGRLLVVDMTTLLGAPTSVTAIGTNLNAQRHGWRPAQGLTAGSDLHLVLGIPGAGGDDVGYGRVTGTIAAGTLSIGAYDMTANQGVPHFVEPGRPAAFGAGPNDVLNGRPTDALWQRGALWFVASAACTPTGDTTARSCVRVGAIQTSSTPTMAQDFMVAKSGFDSFSGGIGLSGTGSVAITWSQASAASKAAISTLGSLQSAWDAPNAIRTPVTLAVGSGTFSGGHWGESVHLAQDPLSGTDVWQAAAYTNGGGGWATSVSRLQLPAPPSVTGSTFHPLTPARLLDTREANGLSGAFGAFTPRTFQVTGRGGVPANASAVTGILTVTGQTSGGWVLLGPVETTSATSSTINFPVGDDRANGVTVALSGSGTLSAVFGAAPGSTVELLFDVTGYFVPNTSGATYVALTPTRLLDTRSANGLPGPFVAGAPRTFQVTGRGGVPVNAVAVTGILTVTGQTSGGWALLGPTETTSATSSTINFPVGDDRANGVTVALSNTGTLSALFGAPAGRTVELIFDVTGYFVPNLTGAKYVPLSPARLLDTRSANGLPGQFVAGTPRTFRVAGRGWVPANAVAVTGILTVTGQTGGGWALLGPVETASASSSTINFPWGDDRANGVTVALGGTGTLSALFGAPAGSGVELLFDVTGYFMP